MALQHRADPLLWTTVREVIPEWLLYNSYLLTGKTFPGLLALLCLRYVRLGLVVCGYRNFDQIMYLRMGKTGALILWVGSSSGMLWFDH